MTRLELDLIAVLSLLGAVNTVYLALLGWGEQEQRVTRRLFRALCLAGSWWALSMALVYSGLGEAHPRLLQASTLFSGYFGPLLYLFTRAWLGRALRRRDALLLLAGLPGTLSFLHTLLAAPPVYEEIARAYLRGQLPDRETWVSNLPVEYVLGLLHAGELLLFTLASVLAFARDAIRRKGTRAETGALAILCLVVLAGVVLTNILPRLGFGTFWPRVAPLVTLPLVIVLALLVGARAAAARRLRQERAELLSFLPTDAVELLLSDQASQRGQQLEAAVLFADLRGFTGASERVEPARLIAWINDYFSAMSAEIVAEQGMVDKLMGDGVLAVFGAPRPLPDAVGHALRAARRMQAALDRLERDTPLLPGLRLGMGVGIHHGLCVAGTVGAARRTYTVFGDVVNTASRIEGLTRQLPCSILLSAAAAERLDPAERAGLVDLGPQPIRGRSEPVRLLGVPGPDP